MLRNIFIALILFMLIAIFEDPYDAVEEWLTAPASYGFINLEDVKTAFNNAKNLDQFEQRLNEIFEGDGLVRFQMVKSEDSFAIKACEDLNNNDSRCARGDDPLFVLFIKNQRAILEGRGVNRYYREIWDYPEADQIPIWHTISDDQLEQQVNSRGHYVYLFISSPGRQQKLLTHRNDHYRTSSRYIKQIQRNGRFEQAMQQRYPSRFTQSTLLANASRTRTNHIQYMQTSNKIYNDDSRRSDANKESTWRKRAKLREENTLRHSRFANTRYVSEYRRSQYSSSSGGGVA
ncbi:hypothetical protein ACQZV8_13890 [Magnetococcales bacterium HHB-1]